MWDLAVDDQKIFVKCVESWAYFKKMTVSPYGNKSAADLVKLVFKS